MTLYSLYYKQVIFFSRILYITECSTIKLAEVQGRKFFMLKTESEWD